MLQGERHELVGGFIRPGIHHWMQVTLLAQLGDAARLRRQNQDVGAVLQGRLQRIEQAFHLPTEALRRGKQRRFERIRFDAAHFVQPAGLDCPCQCPVRTVLFDGLPAEIEDSQCCCLYDQIAPGAIRTWEPRW
jgi:hypothetical protein